MRDHKDDFSVAALERLSRTAPHQALAAQCLRERQRCADLAVELNTARIHWGELKRLLAVPEGGDALASAEDLLAEVLHLRRLRDEVEVAAAARASLSVEPKKPEESGAHESPAGRRMRAI